MQGPLKKWTNYWNGWQPRYFVLADCMLAYYQSEDCVDKECKGAVNITGAEISAHPSDPYRLDVVVPGEQHFFLKAPSPQKRQEWLVALGSVKSCANSEKGRELVVEVDHLKRKQCELRLYCDILVQQVHQIRSAVVDAPTPDVQKLDEGTLMLSETCEIFIKTLDECVNYSNRHSGPSSPVSPKCVTVPHIKDGHADQVHKRVTLPQSSTTKVHSPKRIEAAKENKEKKIDNENKEVKPQVPLTFMGYNKSFSTILLSNDGGIDTLAFLNACSTLTTLCDMMGSTAFSPVKMDLNGNIRKLMQKYETSPAEFSTLQSMVLSELEKGTHTNPNSATDALLWLKRGVWFLREFLHCFQEGIEDLGECANRSYSKTLRQYHGWLVRGVFSVAVKAVPSREDFCSALMLDKSSGNISCKSFESKISPELTSYIAGIDRCLRSLNNFYHQHELDKEETDN